MFILWHFAQGEPVAQLQGIFDTEQMVREVCEVGDCYCEMDKNRVYIENLDTNDLAFYKCPSGKFKPLKGYLKELDDVQEEQKQD